MSCEKGNRFLNVLNIYRTNQQMHTYKYVQSHFVILQQFVSVSTVSPTRVSCNINTISTYINTCTKIYNKTTHYYIWYSQANFSYLKRWEPYTHPLNIINKPYFIVFNPLNAALNPICHLLTLVGVHHILHVSRVRVKQKRKHVIFKTIRLA